MTKRKFAAIIALAFPFAALADITDQTVTLTAGQNLNLDTGAVVASGGDIQFTGSSITFVGGAKGGNLGPLGITGMSGYNTVNLAALQAVQSFASAAPIPASTLAAGNASGSVSPWPPTAGTERSCWS